MEKHCKNTLVAVQLFILVPDRQVVHGQPTKQCNMLKNKHVELNEV